MQILECRSILEKEKYRLKSVISSSLTLVIIQIGKYEENELYLRSKKKLAMEFGVFIFSVLFDEESTIDEIRQKILSFNQDPNIHGIMIQKPILSKFCYQDVVDFIDPVKDVEGLTSFHKKRWACENGILPCTALAVLKVLREYNIRLFHRKIVLVGKSDLVGLPLYEVLKEDNEVTICDSKTKNLKDIIRSADIVVSAIGKANYFTKEYFSSCHQQVVIDVGTNYLEEKLVGDVCCSSLSELNVLVTPVPGGIGLLTPVYLFSNLAMLTKYKN